MNQYEEIVREFRALTNMKHPESGRCCEKAFDGVPECCQKIIDGEDVTFTWLELRALGADLRGFTEMPNATGCYVLNRQLWTPEIIADSLLNGWLSYTLESASHPTRPMLDDRDRLTGVVVIDACNGVIGLEHYRKNVEWLTMIWEAAVALTGRKPYYVTYGLREGWVQL